MQGGGLPFFFAHMNSINKTLDRISSFVNQGKGIYAKNELKQDSKKILYSKHFPLVGTKTTKKGQCSYASANQDRFSMTSKAVSWHSNSIFL